jgi:hypothetical protein
MTAVGLACGACRTGASAECRAHTALPFPLRCRRAGEATAAITTVLSCECSLRTTKRVILSLWRFQNLRTHRDGSKT